MESGVVIAGGRGWDIWGLIGNGKNITKIKKLKNKFIISINISSGQD